MKYRGFGILLQLEEVEPGSIQKMVMVNSMENGSLTEVQVTYLFV
jgi:hypothetical protein